MKNFSGWLRILLPTVLMLFALATAIGILTFTPEEEGVKRTIIPLEVSVPKGDNEKAGGLIVADVNNDGQMDFIVTVPGQLAVYDSSGSKLWIKETPICVGGTSEKQGLPGHHGPGVNAGDVDGDGRCELIYMTRDSVFHVVDGATGKEEGKAEPEVPEGAERWELALVADFFGDSDDGDVLLQATNQEGYRMGKYLAAFRVADLLEGKPPVWKTDQFVSCAHNGARLADLDGDGRDEILGATIFSPDGRELVRAAPFEGHMDSLFVADVDKQNLGLEVVLLEEGSDEVQLMGLNGVIWRKNYKQQEPQNAVVGRFKEGSEEIFIWCRSRYKEHQKPFVFGPEGDLVFHYEMDDVAPWGWTDRGVEVIHRIDWTGERRQLACAKERHRSGDVCIFEPLSGQFVKRFNAKADRLYVADVRGDWREEVIILNGNELHIIENTNPNPRPNEPRLWEDRNYRRLKQCHNYYSP